VTLFPVTQMPMRGSGGGATDRPAMNEGADVKARMYRMLPVLALLAVVVEGLGAGVKWY